MPSTPKKLVDHFFRHESGKLISALVRYFGVQHFDLVEDMVQSAMMEALQVWQTRGVPDQPAAWIHAVAKNRVLDALRRDKSFLEKAPSLVSTNASTRQVELDHLFDESQLEDNQLRMIFACCHPDLPAETAIPLTLKTLCGFNVDEIASGMLLNCDAVRKRIYRAKQTMIEQNISLELPSSRRLAARLHYVHNVLYLMFNEGYSSSNSRHAVRADVCEEAARLCHLLTVHPHCSTRTTSALLALMLFHASRFDARVDSQGSPVLLEDQDREKWDRNMIRRAMDFLRHASGGEANVTSVYHLEATIAMHHCASQSFAQTNWDAIIRAFDLLIESKPSPVYQLNRAIVISQRDGPDAALEIVEKIKSDAVLDNFHLLDATIGELHRMKGNSQQAKQHFETAYAKASSAHDREFLQKRIASCN